MKQNLACPGVPVRHSIPQRPSPLLPGFKPAFWSAYHEVIPKQPGFEERHLIYTLYHYLNHYNLFGSGYYSQCQSILTTLTRDILKDV